MRSPRIAIVGDYQDDHETHPATTAALVEVSATPTWIPTPGVTARALGDYDGIWIAPGSPYRSTHGALEAIRFARTTGTPLLGTCAGFQHVVIEFARNVLGIADAAHAEDDPDASNLFITSLACSLAGRSMSVSLLPGTRAAAGYGRLDATEQYYCNFGLNPDVVKVIEDGGLRVSGIDQDDEPRVIELADHPFFVATLFVPQVSPTPHPLIAAFVSVAR